jgi:hypothetical protein
MTFGVTFDAYTTLVVQRCVHWNLRVGERAELVRESYRILNPSGGSYQSLYSIPDTHNLTEPMGESQPDQQISYQGDHRVRQHHCR